MKLRVLSVFMSMILLFGGMTVLAGDGSGGGNGNGSGSGDGGGDGDGGGQSQLELVEILVETDLDHVKSDATIYLNFSNNVVNMSVYDLNMTCFSLETMDGESVEFDVFLGDDQVDKDIRNTIEIRPTTKWSEGTSYQLTISGDLTSKNGMSLGNDKTVDFKTEGSSDLERGSLGTIITVLIVVVAIIGGFVIGRKRRLSAK